MTTKQALDRVRREAPTVVSLLDDLSDDMATYKLKKAAWDELTRLTEDRVGAKEACLILGVQSSNLYGYLRSEEAHTLFGDGREKPDPVSGWVPVAAQTAGGGRQYHRSDIVALAKAKGRVGTGTQHRKRKRHTPVVAQDT